MFGNFFPGLGGGTFQASYRAYPVSFMDKADAENGDKVFLPSSALDRLGEQAFCSRNRGPAVWNPKLTCSVPGWQPRCR